MAPHQLIQPQGYRLIVLLLPVSFFAVISSVIIEMELFYLGFHTSVKVMLITCDNLFKHPKGLKVLVIGTPVSYAL